LLKPLRRPISAACARRVHDIKIASVAVGNVLFISDDDRLI